MPVDLHFLRPLWFLALIPLAALIIGLWRRRRTATVWQGLVDAHLLPHLLVGAEARPRRLPFALLGLAWLAGVTALAGPVWERLPQPVFTTGAKRVILLDLSASMNAADLAPSRLARARFAVLDLLNATREGQVALIAFGPDPYIVSPLTGDAQTIAAQVPRLTTDLIPMPGPRRPERALALAGELLAQAGAGGGEVILISDGVTESGAGLGTLVNGAARTLAAAGHRLSVLGVGTTQGAPVPDASGGFSAIGNGAIALSRLDREALETLAQVGNGRYVELDPTGRDTQALITAGAPGPLGTMVEQQHLTADQWREEGPWLLLALLPIAALAFRRGWLVPVMALALVLPPGPGWAFGWDDLWRRPDQQAARAFAAGDATAAAERFQDPAWRAAARYRGGDYTGAVADLAGLEGADVDYNRGNALARLGQLDASIAAYERALEQAPDHADARANLEHVRRLRDQQQQENQSSQQGQPDENGEGKDPSASAEQGSQGGDQPPDAADQAGAQNADQPQDQPSDTGQDGAQPQEAGGQDAASSERPGETANSPADTEQAPTGQDAGTPGAPDPAAGRTGKPAPPTAGDLGSQDQAAEPEVSLPDAADADPDATREERQSETTPGQPPGTPAQAGTARRAQTGAADLSMEEREQQQALEAQLQRVPDDPAGLLRQRFLLQHLRREGRLP
jgi:Ca-activated chloride channel family protein